MFLVFATTLVLIFPIIISRSIQQGEPKFTTVTVGAGTSTFTAVWGFNFSNLEEHSSFSLQNSPWSYSPQRWIHQNGVWPPGATLP